MRYDLLIRGGEVIDPSQNVREVRDVAVVDGRIAAVEPRIDVEARVTLDARGLLVVPGLIDLHVHVYRDHTPWGVEPDPIMAAGGVTTMLDTGSAGSSNFAGFRRDVIDRSRAEILALVNLSSIGLTSFNVGELFDRRYADPRGVVETIRRHPDAAVGVKIRASEHIIGSGRQGWDNLRDAIRAARESGTWLMVHIGHTPMSLPEIVAELQPGDCITHCFRGGPQTIFAADGRVFDEVRAAAERGIVFDVGHGMGSFRWENAEAAAEQGFEPTTISTDLHAFNIEGPVWDMPTTMAKFLYLGVPLERVIEMTTLRPARVLGRSDDLGTLKVGTPADIAVLELIEGRFTLTDSHGTTRIGRQMLRAAATVKRGRLLHGGGRFPFERQLEAAGQ
ncbi:MAG: amidohydrolase/deacetylase family metallohydrolase [Planctomycetota bacterium]|nr:MAG: amidohydrolase/deacetylase family metallohydrolase [Planctomycetota bacterium]